MEPQVATINESARLAEQFCKSKESYDKAFDEMAAARKALFAKLGKGHFVAGVLHIHIENDYTVSVNRCKFVS